jgi:hypothetical protein
MRLATDTQQYFTPEETTQRSAATADDAAKASGYETVTISRDSSAYGKFISAYNSAKIEKCGKYWDKSSHCYRYGRAVRVYWNSKDHRTDLSYWINNHITGGQSYDSTGNGYYQYLYNKQGSATAKQNRLLNWLDFFRSSYEQFRTMPTFSATPGGEYLYIFDDTNKLCIRVLIPYNANKKEEYYDEKNEDYTIDLGQQVAEDQLNKLGTDTGTPAASPDDTQTYVLIAAAIIGLAVILKIIKKHKK